MIQMMAVETFVYLYIIGFGFAVFIGAGLLISAARHILKQSEVSANEGRASVSAEARTMAQLGDDS